MKHKMKINAFFLLLAVLAFLCVAVCSCSDGQSVTTSTEATSQDTEYIESESSTDTRDIKVQSIYDIIDGAEHEKQIDPRWAALEQLKTKTNK